MDYAHSLKLVLACSLENSSRSAAFSEGNSKIKCEFSYGSLPRPPESYFVSCAWCIHSDLVCNFLLSLLTIDTNCGAVFVASGSNRQVDDIAAFWPSIERRYAHRQGELWITSHMQHYSCDVCRLFLDSCAVARYAFLHLVFLSCEAGVMMWVHSEECSMFAGADKSSHVLLLFSAYVLHGHARTFNELHLKRIQHSGGFLLDTSHYQQLIESLISLQVQRSSIGFAVSQLKHSMFASPVSHMLDLHIWSGVVCEDLSFFLDTRHRLDELDKSRSNDDGKAAATAGLVMDGFSSVYKSWLDDFVQNIISEQGLMQVIVPTAKIDISSLALLLMQSLPQVFLHILNQDRGFFRFIYVIISGRFSLLTEIPYGSLPRPPDDLLTINFSLLYLKWVS